jgi:hypothetical protein
LSAGGRPRSGAPPLAQRRVVSAGAQAHEAVEAVLVVGRHAQVAEGLGLGVSRMPSRNTRCAVEVHRQHVVVELARLAGGVAQLVGDAGADVAQLRSVTVLWAAPRRLSSGLAQVDLAHVGTAGAWAAAACMFSTLMTRRPVNSSVMRWSPIGQQGWLPPIVPCTSNGGPGQRQGAQLEREPPSSKLDW